MGDSPMVSEPYGHVEKQKTKPCCVAVRMGNEEESHYPQTSRCSIEYLRRSSMKDMLIFSGKWMSPSYGKGCAADLKDETTTMGMDSEAC